MMGLIQRRTNLTLGSIGTTKLIAINSNETVYTISTGYVALEATNLGSFNVYYGDTRVTTNSGGVIVPNTSKFWDSVVDNFSLFLVTQKSGGISSNLVIQEYAGN
jgi:hypothetical protein